MNTKKKYQLIHRQTGDILFEGWFYSIKEAVENAVGQNISLAGVDLSGANLSCANLDEADFSNADLSCVNFNGANLSEACFDDADMHGADLSYACFALSSLRRVNMVGASFAATDITDSIISGCQFSCESVFSLSFNRAELFEKSTFYHDKVGSCSMTKPPIVVSGLAHDIVYLDNVVKIGRDFVSKIDLIAAGDRHLEFIYGREVATFIRPVLYENIVNL